MANRLLALESHLSFSKQISSPVAFLPLLHGWFVVPFVPDQKLRIDLICWRYKLPVRGEETLSISQDRVIIARRHHLCRRKLGKGAVSKNESHKIPKILKCWEKSKVKGYLVSVYASSVWQVFCFSITIDYCYLVICKHNFACLEVTNRPPPPAASCSHGTQSPASVRDPKWPDTAACSTNLRGHEPAKVNPKMVPKDGEIPHKNHLLQNFKHHLMTNINSPDKTTWLPHLGMLCRWCIHVCFGATLSEVDPTAKSCAMFQLRLMLKAILEDGNDVSGGCPDMVDLQRINKQQTQLQLCAAKKPMEQPMFIGHLG